MSVNRFSTALATVILCGHAIPALANEAVEQPAEHNWMPKPTKNVYWQAPNWSNFNFPPTQRQSAPAPVAPPQAYNNYYQQPPAPPAMQPAQPQAQQQRTQQPGYQQRPPMNNNYGRPPAPRYNPNMNRARPPMPNSYQGYPPPPRGPYSNSRDNGASAYNMPGYHRYRNNNWNRNKFWGKSGPSKWMNPSKDNMEQGWDDMINAPSRMGKMPGGWYAPEVTMPNPVDMGDQMQDNMKDLPEQIRNMDVGNDVRD